MVKGRLEAARYRMEDSFEAVNGFYDERGWSDGLPIVPPTADRVEKMLEGTSRRPDEIIGALPPKWGEASVEKIAINAVMAGCLPEYMPIIVTAIEAMLEERFNMLTVQATTNPVAPLVIVNGPLAKQLDINSGHDLFGPGRRSNATIGRCIRLILRNIGGAIPGESDKSTQGSPAKYTFCIAENEEANPWEPLHVEKGFSQETSTVTVYPVESIHNINDHEHGAAADILKVVTGTITNLGMNQIAFPSRCELLVVMCPEHARSIARDGWSKEDVKRFIADNARLPLHQLKLSGMFTLRDWPKWMQAPDDNAMLPVTADWHNVMVVVGGGAGKHSCFLSSLGLAHCVTRAVRL